MTSIMPILPLFLLFVLSVVHALQDQQCGNFFHAHCQLHLVFPNAPCDLLLLSLGQQFEHCCKDKEVSEPYTRYSLLSLNKDALYVEGEITFEDGYRDVQRIQLKEACSESTSFSYYDHYANYCNIRNIVRGIGYEYNEEITSCRWHPQQTGLEDKICARQ